MQCAYYFWFSIVVCERTYFCFWYLVEYKSCIVSSCVDDRTKDRGWCVVKTAHLNHPLTTLRNYKPCKTTRWPRLHKFYFPRLTARGKYNRRLSPLFRVFSGVWWNGSRAVAFLRLCGPVMNTVRGLIFMVEERSIESQDFIKTERTFFFKGVYKIRCHTFFFVRCLV